MKQTKQSVQLLQAAALLLSCLSNEAREVEFGRFLVEPSFQKKIRSKLEPNDYLVNAWDFFDTDLSLSFDYSAPTASPDATGTAKPSSSRTLAPSSATDTSSPGGTPTAPTVEPTSAAPTITPLPTSTLAPTVEPTARVPTTTAPPTLVRDGPTPDVPVPTEDIVFACAETGVALATPPFTQVTVIPFDLAYLVETVVPSATYQQSLDDRILADVVQGALNCGPGIFESNAPAVPIETIPTGEACTAEISVCSVFEASFAIAVEGDLATDTTSLLGYARLSSDMASYPNDLTNLDRVEYLRPDLFSPITDNETTPPDGSAGSVDSGPVNISPYTIGAVLAVCIGGITALGVWARNRRRRNEQHLQLLEDMSVGEPETDAA